MSGAVHAVNRLVALVVGLVLIVLGVAAVTWWTGNLAQWWTGAPYSLDPTRVETVTRTTWWIWVALLGGLIAIAVALRWLRAHLRTDSWGPVRLPGSSGEGRLTLDPSAVTGHYADLVGGVRGVRSVHARLVRDGERPVLEATTRISPDADLQVLADRIVELTREAQQVLGIDRLGARHRLSVSRRQQVGARRPT